MLIARLNSKNKFINHSFEFANYVCFILPQLFESDGKGVPRKRVKGYNLIHSILNNKKVNTVYIYEVIIPNKKKDNKHELILLLLLYNLKLNLK